MDASPFSIKPIWMQEVKSYLETCQMLKNLNLVQKHKLAKKTKPFTTKEGKMYRVGQNNKFHKCLTTHYKKSWIFKRFNLIKMSTLTKRMFTLTKGMGHERHMVLLVGFFD
jgi:hypothetical protein